MKTLTRSRDDRWIGGVCGGVADYTGIDVNVIRIVLAVCTVLGAGSLIIGYVVAWLIMPRRPLHDTVRAQAHASGADAPTTTYEPAPR